MRALYNVKAMKKYKNSLFFARAYHKRLFFGMFRAKIELQGRYDSPFLLQLAAVNKKVLSEIHLDPKSREGATASPLPPSADAYVHMEYISKYFILEVLNRRKV